MLIMEKFEVPLLDGKLQWGMSKNEFPYDKIIVSQGDKDGSRGHEVFLVENFLDDIADLKVEHVAVDFIKNRLSTVIINTEPLQSLSTERWTCVLGSLVEKFKKFGIIPASQNDEQSVNLNSQVESGIPLEIVYYYGNDNNIIELSLDAEDTRIILYCKQALVKWLEIENLCKNNEPYEQKLESFWDFLEENESYEIPEAVSDTAVQSYKIPLFEFKNRYNGMVVAITFGDKLEDVVTHLNLELYSSDDSEISYRLSLLEWELLDAPCNGDISFINIGFFNDRYEKKLYSIYIHYIIDANGETDAEAAKEIVQGIDKLLSSDMKVNERELQKATAALDSDEKFSAYMEDDTIWFPVWTNEYCEAQFYVDALYQNAVLEFRISGLYDRIMEATSPFCSNDEECHAKERLKEFRWENEGLNIGDICDRIWYEKANDDDDVDSDEDDYTDSEEEDIDSDAQQCDNLQENANENIDALMEELQDLVGLTEVKEDVQSIINSIKINNIRAERGLPQLEVSNHLVFSGNPGTGKTTVARLLAKIYKRLGLLSKGQLIETDRAGLVAEYVGQTAIKTTEVVESAIGGVLFIDEAYTLSAQKHSTDYGSEAIDTLLKLMEDNRKNLIVIVAGYTNLMEDFLDSNPGMKSRFNKYIDFPDYTPDELVEIFKGMCKKLQFTLKSDAEILLATYFEKIYKNRDEDFGNARTARNIFERTIGNLNDRIALLPNIKDEDLITIYPEDIQAAIDD